MIRVFADGWADLRFAARVLRRGPGFALAAILSLGLGIGAATAIFTVLDAVVLRTLPVHAPSELYLARIAAGQENSSRFSYPLFERARDTLAHVASLSASSSIARMLVTESGASVPGTQDVARVQLVSGEYFGVLGATPQLGRLLIAEDNRSLGAHPVAVISDGYWTRRFGRRPDILNRAISVNGAAFTIVGVTAPGFFGIVADSRPDVWVPIMMQSAVRYANNADIEDGDIRKPWVPQPEVSWLTMIGRVQSEQGRQAAEAALTGLLQQQLARRESYRTDPDIRRRLQAQHVVLGPGARGLSRLREQIQSPLVALFAMVGLLLVIACANLAALLTARSAARQRELAVRVSIGAGRGRLLRQFLAESMLLGIIGGGCGLVLARWACDALLALVAGAPTTLPVDMPLDRRVLLFASAVSILTGLAFGLVPALRACRVDPAETLSAYGRSIVGGGRSARLPLGRLLVVGQLALTVLLLSVAALFTRTLQQLVRVHVGYDDHGVVVARIDPRAAGYTPERLPELHRAIVARLEGTPGIRSASLSLHGPLSGGARTTSLAIEGFQPPPGTSLEMQDDVVTEHYFGTVGLTLLRGRLFGPEDRANGRASIINETMARRFFAGRNPIGQRWTYGDPIGPDAHEIIGVVSDAHYNDLRGAIPNAVYRLASQTDEFLMSVEARAAVPADVARQTLRSALASVDARVPLIEVTTLDARVRGLTALERSVSLLATAFGLVALVLACLGLYGTMSYNVARRTPELGIRMALGANHLSVLWLVLRDACRIVLTGLAVGLPLAVLAAEQTTEFLYGVAPADLASYSAAAGVLVAIALLAAWLPARRAAAVDPVVALRSE
jgi:predicted permease